jgi:hypothetical protein
VRDLDAFGVQRLVVSGQGGDGVQRQVELVAPSEFEAGLAEGVVALLGAGVALGEGVAIS